MIHDFLFTAICEPEFTRITALIKWLESGRQNHASLISNTWVGYALETIEKAKSKTKILSILSVLDACCDI